MMPARYSAELLATRLRRDTALLEKQRLLFLEVTVEAVFQHVGVEVLLHPVEDEPFATGFTAVVAYFTHFPSFLSVEPLV